MDWKLNVLAYRSIKFEMEGRENAIQIRAPNISARVATMQFMFRLLKIPLEESVIIPLATVFASDRCSEYRDLVKPDFLCTMMTAAGTSLAAMIPARNALQGPGLLDAPVVPPGICMRSLHTE